MTVLQKLRFVMLLTDCSKVTKVMFIKDNPVVMGANRRIQVSGSFYY